MTPPTIDHLDDETRALVVPLLPATGKEIVELIGLEAALSLFANFGGTERRFNKAADGLGHAGDRFKEIAAVVGEENALHLREEFGSEPVYIPQCLRALSALRRRRMILDYDQLLKSMSAREAANRIARSYGTSNRSVEKAVNGKTQPSRAKKCHGGEK